MEQVELTHCEEVPKHIQKQHESGKKQFYVEVNQSGAEEIFQSSRGIIPYERALDLTAIKVKVLRLTEKSWLDEARNDFIRTQGVVMKVADIASALNEAGYLAVANWWEGYAAGDMIFLTSAISLGYLATGGDLYIGEREKSLNKNE
jgi:hypothetical protein